MRWGKALAKGCPETRAFATAARRLALGHLALSKTRVHSWHKPGAARVLLPCSLTGHLLGYARVSTTAQDPQLQLAALSAAGCACVFLDRASATESIDTTTATGRLLFHLFSRRAHDRGRRTWVEPPLPM